MFFPSSEEGQILAEFLNTIKEFQGQTLVTWSKFDTQVLSERIKLNGLKTKPLYSLKHFDLRYAVRKSFIFPTYGYGLKSIGSFLGYPFKNPNLNGLQVALAYYEHLKTKAPLEKELFQYNVDDVKVLPYIFDWVEHNH